MKLKQLQALLEDVEPFAAPKIELEQYATGAHLAARILHTAHGLGDVEGRVVVDLGCGCGVLGIAAVLMGASHVLGVDVDANALQAAASNCEQFEDLHMELLRADVALLPRLQADTVVTNPPFGTRRKGADLDFLRAACGIARTAVYSLHKTSTREHVQRYAESTLGMSGEVLAQLRYDLPASYAFHRSATKDVEVDLWRFARRASGSAAP